MTFAWQGFRLEIPADWAPVSVSGHRREGYVRLAGTSDSTIQVRWKEMRSPNLSQLLDRYLSTLRKGDFTADIEPIGESEIRYHWKSRGQGRGGVIFRDGRLFFIEATGTRRAQLLPLFTAARETFGATSSWSVLGLTVSPPEHARLEKHAFRSGRTDLAFSGGLSFTRWGLAEQLLRERPIVDWARTALDMPAADASFEDQGIRLSARSMLSKRAALVKLESDQNQIVTVTSSKLTPEWEWLA